jgi:hypothetical protein
MAPTDPVIVNVGFASPMHIAFFDAAIVPATLVPVLILTAKAAVVIDEQLPLVTRAL